VASTNENEHYTMTGTYDLVAAARAKFGELSAAEEKLLRCAESGDVAYCGPSEKDDDPANDPAKAADWGNDRTIRAKLIRWLCIDGEASQHVDPHGIQVHAAQIGDPASETDLDLSAATIPFRLSFELCSFQVSFGLIDARIVALNLRGTRVPGLAADRVVVSGSVYLRNGFHSEGEVSLQRARIGADLNCNKGTFLNNGGLAICADGIKVAHAVFLHEVLKVEGEVRLVGAEIGGQLRIEKAQFADGAVVRLENATVKQGFFWTGIAQNGAVRLNLAHASVGPIGDDEASWPKKGNLLLDGFTYERIGEGPTTAAKRLEWLARQPDGFVPQPYRQLAKVLRESGDDAGARKVLIAMEDARLKFGGLGRMQRIASRILRATVGYGYTPLRALWFIAAFVILGSVLFWWGHTARVITQVKGDSPAQADPFNPFIYSLETFLPLVDLHMAKHWMPDPNATPTVLIGPFSDTPMQTPLWLGRVLRWYLWLHILLGWFFSSMFIAGITGLVRRDQD
jgi:hypothetical protein